MQTHNSLRAHSLRLLATAVAALGFSALASVSHAEELTSWVQYNPSKTAVISSGMGTGNPVFGDGSTAGSADGQSIFDLTSQTYTLTNVGDSLTFSGDVAFTGLSAAQSDQFHFGIYNTNGQSPTATTGGTGWLGYYASNAGAARGGTGPTYSDLWERSNPNTGNFGSDTGATSLKSVNPANGSSFVSGDYTFSLTLTLVSTGIQISWTLTNTIADTYSLVGSVIDTSPQTLSFNSVGINTGGTLNASQVSLSNLDLTYTAAAIPEPATTALLMGAALSLVLIIPLRRRLRAAR